MPPGIELKPLKYKYTMHDYREHRRIDFHSKRLELDRDDVYKSDDVNTALSSLQHTLKRVMDECFPSKTVRMSSRDPPWMTPLAKTLLKKKAKLQTSKRGGCLVNLPERINTVITENRKALSDGRIGSKAWWKKVDRLSKRILFRT